MATLKTIRRDERGQLLLVGAFILAILLVALAVVLNAAIYTETYAAQGNDRVDVSDTVQYRADTERSITGLVASFNANVGTIDAVNRTEAADAFNDSVATWDDISAHQQAATGRATSVTVDNVTVRTNVSQTNASLALTNDSAEPEWAVVENVSDNESFVLRVAPADLNTTTNATDPAVLDDEVFYIKIENDTETWRVFVFQGPDASSVTIVVDSPATTTADTFAQNGTDPVVVDFVTSTVDGAEITNLSVLSEVTGTYNVTFVNGDEANGTYTLVTDGEVDTTNYSTDPDAGPTARAVVTSVDVTLRYEMPNLSYEIPISVTTGGADDV